MYRQWQWQWQLVFFHSHINATGSNNNHKGGRTEIPLDDSVFGKGLEDKVISQYHCRGKVNPKKSTCLVCLCESLGDAAHI